MSTHVNSKTVAHYCWTQLLKTVEYVMSCHGPNSHTVVSSREFRTSPEAEASKPLFATHAPKRQYLDGPLGEAVSEIKGEQKGTLEGLVRKK